MFCKNCGKKLLDNARFCNMCGSQVDINVSRQEEKKEGPQNTVEVAVSVTEETPKTEETKVPKAEERPAKADSPKIEVVEEPKIEERSIVDEDSKVIETPVLTEELKVAEVPVAPVLVESPETAQKLDAIQGQLSAIQESLDAINNKLSNLVTKEECQSKYEDIKNSIDGLSDVVKQKENKFKEVIKQMLD